jgi:RsmE family RNA methyltransferase
MNLLLLDPAELLPDGTARLDDRRLAHAREVWKVAVGDQLRVGVLGGNTGLAEVLDTHDALHLRVTLTDPPPARPAIDVLLATPRPKALGRIFSTVAQLGVDRLVLMGASRVEKSYFSSPTLAPATVRRLLLEGLEQARDTVLPEVIVRERFRPFVQDELDGMFPGRRLLLHPDGPRGRPEPESGRLVLAIGPEGGWIPAEVDALVAKGFALVSLGERILRTETVLPYVIGALGR